MYLHVFLFNRQEDSHKHDECSTRHSTNGRGKIMVKDVIIANLQVQTITSIINN